MKPHVYIKPDEALELLQGVHDENRELRMCAFVLAVAVAILAIIIAVLFVKLCRPLDAGLSDTQIPSKVRAGAVSFTCSSPPSERGEAAPAPLALHAFAVHVISLEGNAPAAHEIADAMFAEGVPRLTPYMSKQEAVLVLLAVMRQESHFRLGCIGDGGRAIGLMQWQHRYYAKYSGAKTRAEWTKATHNIRAGATVMSHRLSTNKDMWLAVQRYNSPYAKRIGRYANSVKSHYQHYRLLLQNLKSSATEYHMERL